MLFPLPGLNSFIHPPRQIVILVQVLCPHALRHVQRNPVRQRSRDRVIIELSTGDEFSFAPRRAQGLEKAKPSDLDVTEISPSGFGLHFPKLDADVWVPALLEGVFGSRRWMAARLGARGGRVKSRAKARAARANGRLGGRPRKKRRTG
jgi:hypothetical protein